MSEAPLTHLDEQGRARMVDVGDKPVSQRRAVACAVVRMTPATAQRLVAREVPKGDVLATARIAGIQAAKRTSELIPLCHALPLSSVSIDEAVDTAAGTLTLVAEARTTAQTGVEMEALTAASVAALTAYDMLKALERGIEIASVVLLEKSGGESGEWRRGASSAALATSEGSTSLIGGDPSIAAVGLTRRVRASVRAAVLTVSTSVTRGTREDRSGDALARLAVEAGAEVGAREVVTDDAEAIEAALRRLVEEGADLVFTTGGTGLTPDDVTPEATRAVIERDAPGFAEAMRAESIRRTPMGILSRGVAGIAGRTLIINFPGNPKAIEETFPVLAPTLAHVVETLAGRSVH